VEKQEIALTKEEKEIAENLGLINATSDIKNVFTNAVDEIKDKDVKQADIQDQTGKIIEKLHQSAIIHSFQNNEDIQNKVVQSAEENVLAEIEIRRNQQIRKVENATYDALIDSAQNFGIDSGRPMWQLKLAKFGSGFWFIIWYLISFFTFTPITVFLKMIGVQVRSAKLKWLFTVLIYLGFTLLVVWIVIGISLGDWNWSDGIKK
jgi:hypothetical protein